ncbi:GspH/FimT family pseudopilin [Chitinimonas sp. PSY-7]|uniref:GspH/FimT family pseudopilin n=1 Tax=Chitinimonas sp. PSY-7 TaxID=3459088 RepID=UPI00403FD5DA
MPQYVATRCRGFTLVELAITLVVMAILLAVLAPRLFDTSQFATRGFADRLIANLRFARELAIAQRAPVYVRLSASQVQFCLDSACTQAATGADGTTPFVMAIPDGLTLATTSNFSFDGLGATSLGSTLSVSLVGDQVVLITVEADTGYVH